MKQLETQAESNSLITKNPEYGADVSAVSRVGQAKGEEQIPCVLDEAGPLNPESFPDKPRPGSTSTPATIRNVKHLLHKYGIVVRYNVIKKNLIIHIPGLSGTVDNKDSVAMSHIISLAVLNGLATGLVPEFVSAIADRDQINPVADWIKSKSWDGVDRLQELYGTLVTRGDYPEPLKQVLIYKWLISAVAAVLMASGFRTRGVLTLQGPQSLGKTSWFNALVSDQVLREHVIKLDHHLDAGDKDTKLTAISHWIVEIGELDSSFKKDVARLKGFLTSDRDKIRKPYGRTNCEYSRKTIFCASVNDSNFLVDSTGNTRFWTIPVISVNYEHGIDMQQLFAQITVDFEKGEKWWLTPDEEKCLERYNNLHRTISVIHESIMAIVDMERIEESKLPAMTALEMLLRIGMRNPTNSQCKEAANVLRELFGDSKRIKGQNKWRIPFIKDQNSYSWVSAGDDDDKY